jgi:hypothetical protein
VFDDDLTVKYIALVEESGELKVDLYSVDATQFHREYKKLEDYPIKRAAQHFLKPLTSAIVVKPAAQRHLDHIMENKMSTTETVTKGPAKKSATAPAKKGTWDETKAADAGQGNVNATSKASVRTNNKVGGAPTVKPAVQKKPTAAQQTAAKKKIAAEKASEKEAAAKAKQKERDDVAAAKNAAKGKAPPKVIKAAKAAKKAAPKKKPTPAKKVAKLVRNPKHDAKQAPAKKAKTQEKAGRPGAFTEDQHITILVKDNPKREGTGAHEIFELLRKSKTVGEFYKKGGASSNLRWNIDHEYIKVK